MYIGNRSDATRYFDGKMADVRFYNRILSADEVATIYACRGHDGIVSGLVGRWKLDELAAGAGAAPIDYSGNGNDGSVVGSPVYSDHPLSYRRTT